MPDTQVLRSLQAEKNIEEEAFWQFSACGMLKAPLSTLDPRCDEADRGNKTPPSKTPFLGEKETLQDRPIHEDEPCKGRTTKK